MMIADPWETQPPRRDDWLSTATPADDLADRLLRELRTVDESARGITVREDDGALVVGWRAGSYRLCRMAEGSLRIPHDERAPLSLTMRYALRAHSSIDWGLVRGLDATRPATTMAGVLELWKGVTSPGME